MVERPERILIDLIDKLFGLLIVLLDLLSFHFNIPTYILYFFLKSSSNSIILAMFFLIESIDLSNWMLVAAMRAALLQTVIA